MISRNSLFLPIAAAALAASCAHAPPSSEDLYTPAADKRHCQLTAHMIRDAYGANSGGGALGVVAYPSSSLSIRMMEVPGLSETEARELEGLGAFDAGRHDCDWASLGLSKTALVSSSAGALTINLPIYTADGQWAAAQSYRRNSSRTCVFHRTTAEWRVALCSDDIIVVANSAAP